MLSGESVLSFLCCEEEQRVEHLPLINRLILTDVRCSNKNRRATSLPAALCLFQIIS